MSVGKHVLTDSSFLESSEVLTVILLTYKDIQGFYIHVIHISVLTQTYVLKNLDLSSTQKEKKSMHHLSLRHVCYTNVMLLPPPEASLVLEA